MAKNTELKLLIQRYVERQQLVYDIIQKLHPDFLLCHKLKTATDAETHQILDMVKSYKDVPQSGFWGVNNEWQYFFHGGGCRLVHTVTKEPIDWDPPDITIFDLHKFKPYVVWSIFHVELGHHGQKRYNDCWGQIDMWFASQWQQLDVAGIIQKVGAGYLYQLT